MLKAVGTLVAVALFVAALGFLVYFLLYAPQQDPYCETAICTTGE